MSTHSPHPNSLSPHTNSSKKSQSSAFVWPIPSSPSHLKPSNNSQYNSINMNELTVREILDRYNEDPELLKYILTAKSEEDKKKAAKDTLKAEEARIQLRQMDLDLAREQTKASARYERVSHPVATYVPPPHIQHHPPPPQSATHQPPLPPPTTTAAYGPYYGLAPVQQQVLARFSHPAQYNNHQHPPASPSVPYPHSAHPLCPPSSSNSNNEERSRLQQFHQKSPSSPITEDNSSSSNNNFKKRNRSSISSPNDSSNDQQQQQQQHQQQDKLSHNKVMEALKAKIQRGNGGPPSPLTGSPIRSLTNHQQQQQDSNKKRKPTLPRPVVVHQQIAEGSSPSPSPRSAKPVLPPIDTNLGRIDNTATHSNAGDSTKNEEHLNATEKMQSSTSTSSTSSNSISSNSIGSHHTAKTNHINDAEESTKKSSSNKEQQQQQQEATSPSDHILLNTRRARSLSPLSVVKKA